jgi:hypothetical protein
VWDGMEVCQGPPREGRLHRRGGTPHERCPALCLRGEQGIGTPAGDRAVPGVEVPNEMVATAGGGAISSVMA